MHTKTRANTETMQTIEGTYNTTSITTEPPYKNGQQPKLPGRKGLNAFYWHQIR